MPWKEIDVVDQRTEFVMRVYRDKEAFSEVCREFGISRKTGYKWKARFLEDGLSGLGDQSRRPAKTPHALSEDEACEIIKLKLAHPTWGARKLRAVLARRRTSAEVPSESSFKRVLGRVGLVEPRRRRRAAEGRRVQTPVRAERPNHVWTIDFKGWWYTRDRRRFEPLTIRDDFSRYVLCAQAMKDSRTQTVQEQMARVFHRYGLPEIIRSDNGAPFAAFNSPLGLSRLSAWWLSLGIDLDRILPGRPDQNGGHERMHRDLALEIESKADFDADTQQATLDVWRRTFNEERPHEALGMRVPNDVYHKSPRRFNPDPVELDYPASYLVRRVGSKGMVKVHDIRVALSTALCGLRVGLEPMKDHRLAVWYCKLCLGQIDLTVQKFQAATPAGPNQQNVAPN
jgi:putative transposase